VKILIADDEERLLEVLTVSFQFQWQDSTVLAARTGAEALDRFSEDDPDIIVLDVGLPDTSGFDVLREIRRVSDVPVIMLTAARDEVDQVKGLDLGADDYLVKPFSRLALLAHVKAVLRRAELPPPISALPDFEAGDLAIRFQSQHVTVRGTLVKLTPFEYKLLYHLVRNAGRLMPHRALMERIWGTEYEPTEHQLRVLVNRVRAKIESPGNAPLIQTERGAGYRFVRPAARPVGESSLANRT
jgi:two-component system KDP operon response regulator KdpE